MKGSNNPQFFAFYMYDAESLENCTTFDDHECMIIVYNFKTTSYNKHLDDNFLFMYTAMSIPLTSNMKPGLGVFKTRNDEIAKWRNGTKDKSHSYKVSPFQ